jgi:hypothetical protein
MYERVSFISVSKPGRIIAPGVVLCAQKKVLWQLCERRCFGERTAGEEMLSAPAYLGVQPVAEKIPVNFLLFTGKANFALLLVVPEWQPRESGRRRGEACLALLRHHRCGCRARHTSPYEGSSWGKACLAPANERVKRHGDSGLEPLLEPALQAHVVVRPPAIIDGMRKLLVLGMGRHQSREPFVQ